MEKSVKDFMESVSKRNQNEPEFLQAVHEVAETVIPFIEKNKKYQNTMLRGAHGRAGKSNNVPCAMAG